MIIIQFCHDTKNKASPAIRSPCEIWKQDFSKFFKVDFLDSLTKSLDKSNLGKNLSDPDTEFSKFLNIFLKCLDTYVPNQNFLEKK